MPFSARRQKQVVVAPQWTHTCRVGERRRRCYQAAGGPAHAGTRSGRRGASAVPRAACSAGLPLPNKWARGAGGRRSGLDRRSPHGAAWAVPGPRPHPGEHGPAAARCKLLGRSHGGREPRPRQAGRRELKPAPPGGLSSLSAIAGDTWQAFNAAARAGQRWWRACRAVQPQHSVLFPASGAPALP